MTTIYRKITNKNIDSGYVVIYPEDVLAWYRGEIDAFVVVDECGNELERYYGYGLRKLMNSMKRYKDEDWGLGFRHLK